ncbi:MAG: CotH kinase family protein, partial [Lachnospiraceae bacterium]|nr:CotH kinase family protein [Lachnospiraceae bacterium]
KKDFRLPDEKVDKCNVIRAAVFSSDGRVSKTVTRSYFVGFDRKDMYDDIKVISLVSDPDDLFGNEKGIFVLGDIGIKNLQERYEESEEATAIIEENPDIPLDGSVKIGDVGYNRDSDGNYLQHGIDWERETDMTLFSNDHESVAMQQIVGLRIKGNSSRQYPLKGLNLYARKAYSGKSTFDVPFFEGSGSESGISLSAGGTDRYTMTKDAFMSERIRDTGIDVAAGRYGEPVYVFLNGEFWGAYIIAEKIKEDFFADNYGVRRDNVVFIKEGEVEAGRSDDIHYYYAFLSLYEDKNFSDEHEYAEFCDAVDINSLMDYYSIRIFSEYGLDWPHLNYGFWRTKEPEDSPYGDCKWRFVNFDNNAALNYDMIDVDMMDVLYNGSKFVGKDELFTALMENEGFRKEFEKRFKEVTGKVFSSKDALKCYDRIANVMKIPVSSSYKRWYGSGNSYGEVFYNEKTEKIKLFLKERENYIQMTK